MYTLIATMILSGYVHTFTLYGLTYDDCTDLVGNGQFVEGARKNYSTASVLYVGCKLESGETYEM